MTKLSELLPSGGGAKEFSAVASGTLPSGQTVGLKTDGKVEVISTGSAAMSSGINVDPDQPLYMSSVYVSSVDRIALMWRNMSTSYPEAVIGQISGSSITFGTVKVISTATLAVGVTYSGLYDPSADKIVLFVGGGTYYSGFVGTVTGGATNDSSWGSQQFASNTGATALVRTSVYMPDVQKCLLFYRQNASGANYLKVASCTVNSNSTITWIGRSNVDTANQPSYNDYGTDSTYDSQYGVAVVAYNVGQATSLKATPVDVDSSGSITKGTTRTLSNGQGYWDNVAIDFDSSTNVCGLIGNYAGQLSAFGIYMDSATTLAQGANGPYGLGGLASGNTQGSIKSNGNNQFIYAYRYNAGGVQKPNYWTLNIDANKDLINTSQSLNFGTTGDAGSFGIGYDSTTQKFVIAFYSAGTSDKNQAHLYNFTTSNLSSFIGITSEAIANTATGKVNPQGGVATPSISLTTGSTYYVQSDGSLSTNSSTVTAGKAISTTQLVLKGAS